MSSQEFIDHQALTIAICMYHNNYIIAWYIQLYQGLRMHVYIAGICTLLIGRLPRIMDINRLGIQL